MGIYLQGLERCKAFPRTTEEKEPNEIRYKLTTNVLSGFQQVKLLATAEKKVLTGGDVDKFDKFEEEFEQLVKEVNKNRMCFTGGNKEKYKEAADKIKQQGKEGLSLWQDLSARTKGISIGGLIVLDTLFNYYICALLWEFDKTTIWMVGCFIIQRIMDLSTIYITDYNVVNKYNVEHTLNERKRVASYSSDVSSNSMQFTGKWNKIIQVLLGIRPVIMGWREIENHHQLTSVGVFTDSVDKCLEFSRLHTSQWIFNSLMFINIKVFMQFEKYERIFERNKLTNVYVFNVSVFLSLVNIVWRAIQLVRVREHTVFEYNTNRMWMYVLNIILILLDCTFRTTTYVMIYVEFMEDDPNMVYFATGLIVLGECLYVLVELCSRRNHIYNTKKNKFTSNAFFISVMRFFVGLGSMFHKYIPIDDEYPRYTEWEIASRFLVGFGVVLVSKFYHDMELAMAYWGTMGVSAVLFIIFAFCRRRWSQEIRGKLVLKVEDELSNTSLVNPEEFAGTSLHPNALTEELDRMQVVEMSQTLPTDAGVKDIVGSTQTESKI